MADEKKPSRSKAVLGGKKSEAPEKELDSIQLEHTANGMVKATHLYKNSPESEIHALPHTDVIGHIRSSFGLDNEKKSIDAKKSNVAAYEAEHGSLTSPKAPTPVAAEPDQYDKIRETVRQKATKPAASLDELFSRADKLTK